MVDKKTTIRAIYIFVYNTSNNSQVIYPAAATNERMNVRRRYIIILSSSYSATPKPVKVLLIAGKSDGM